VTKAWAFNRDYKDLEQVVPFWPAYEAVFEELTEAGDFPFNDRFRGRIPGIEGPGEDSAIYLLQNLRYLRDHVAKLAAYRAAGWRDYIPGELETPERFAGIVEHSFDSEGTGWREWVSARLARFAPGTVVVLPRRARTRGSLVTGLLLVLDDPVTAPGARAEDTEDGTPA
jgi:hypothetical protein